MGNHKVINFAEYKKHRTDSAGSSWAIVDGHLAADHTTEEGQYRLWQYLERNLSLVKPDRGSADREIKQKAADLNRGQVLEFRQK